MNKDSQITWYTVRERNSTGEHHVDQYIAWYKIPDLAIDFARYHSTHGIKVYVQRRTFIDENSLKRNSPSNAEIIWQSWSVNDGTFGKNIGYSETPCPKCGRMRLEQYDNGNQVCEKCQWCPQTNDYVTDEDIFGKQADWHIEQRKNKEGDNTGADKET